MDMTLIAERRPVRIFERDGREVYADTGRPVDERLGSHVTLWIVEDPEAWAAAIEAEGDAELAKWPKRQRDLAEYRRGQAYQSAAQVRSDGAHRAIYTHHHIPAAAAATVADLCRSHPNPGVRYEVAAITGAGACPDCAQPRIFTDGQWRHHSGGYPTACTPRRAPEPERAAGEFEVDTGTGAMTCGYCDVIEHWAEAALGYVRLTGFRLLGVEKATNDLVVLAEATTLSGQTIGLPHHCLNIPEDLHHQHAPTTNLRRAPVAGRGRAPRASSPRYGRHTAAGLAGRLSGLTERVRLNRTPPVPSKGGTQDGQAPTDVRGAGDRR
ncbi:MAG: hypothetical protein V7603_5152 [Micromonosporaceae bacterium]